MDDSATDALRKLAPCWTLAGDEQLLSILQNTHQRLLSKCQEANNQLEQMATALNDASVSLQNVNNQFMALSNSQFIETRVYDDDEMATEVPVVKELPKPEVPDELTSLKRSISVLENAHEIITILQDSDTESESDDEMPARLVLKPKDMYATRPLPYIIGSQSWKNKWHAGLLLEDSDSDSSASKVDHDSDQYSQSEPEDTHTDKLPVPHTHTTVSESSSELPSDQGSVPKPSPSDVASEIARRLGAREPPKVLEREPEYEEPPKPSARKIYRPQDPVPSTIFPDEPPPLSDHSDSQESDIFAELHRSEPFAKNNLADDLFGDNENENDSDEGDIFSDFANKPSAKPTSLFDSGPSPNMFVKHTDNHHSSNDQRRNIRDDRRNNIGVNDDRGNSNVKNDEGSTADVRARGDEDTAKGVKKPIGGISLFGNKGTESIGAAILNRNKRKSSTSGEDSESENSRSESQSNQQRKEKDIFDDLFARSDAKKVTKDKDLITEIKKKTEEKTKDRKIEKPKVDLFSDNLFDDIDDIFSTDVVKMPAKDNINAKSIFEDDDDLFSEIAAPKPMRIEVASSSNNKKSLFDSDDELFSENITQVKPDDQSKETPKSVEPNKPKVAARTKFNEASKISKNVTKSIFDDDEELFSDVKTNKSEVSKVENTSVSIEKPNDFGKSDQNVSKNIAQATTSDVFKSPSLFDDDEDESELFAEPTKSTNVQNVIAASAKDTKRPSKTEIKIPEEVVTASCSVKTKQVVVDKNENIDLNKDRGIEINVNSLKDEKASVLPISENVDSKKPISEQTNAAKIFDHIHKKLQNIEQSSSHSNNDYSDQDFDDLPPKEETNKNINSNIVSETDAIPTEKLNIFDKTTLEEDIDELFVTAQQNTDNTETIFKNAVPDFTETILKDTNKTEEDNKTNEIATKDIETDIFSNILTEPPVFEKPKEPKRSKNVNALFDDDSDDESLFFKKNDPIFVENPEEFTPTQDRIFGLFTDEPPDDGFSKISDDFDEDMFSTLPKPRISQNEDLPPIPDTFADSSPSDNKIPDIEKVVPSEEKFCDLPKDEVKPTVGITKEPSLDIEEHIFKLPTTDNTDKSFNERQTSTAMSDEKQLFTIPANKSKPTLQDKPSPDLLSDDENLFTTISKLDKPTSLTLPELENKNLESVSKSSADELFTSLQNTDIAPLPENKLQDSKSDEDLFKIPGTKPEFIPKSDEIPSTDLKPEKTEKKVGKLKVGLNINVNALLPGASPKKVKPNDQPDGQSQSVTESPKPEPKIHSELEPKIPLIQNADSKLLKSVSFDGKPESDVLDNKLSKERAKIQVKRRPSTRRARREAVRKSGIDFGEDSTDNSSSLDDPPRKQPDIRKEAKNDAKTNEIKQNIHTELEAKLDDTTKQAEIHPNVVEKQSTIEPAAIERRTDFTEKPSYSRDVKSKVVYILNDEDIFNTGPIKEPESVDRNISEKLESNIGVTTLGKVYDKAVNVIESSAKKDPKSSVFDDDNDEEIFQAKTTAKKTAIFDSDSEEDLFGTNKKEEKRVEKIEVKKEIKREVVKGSLFGDEDDDDDLFGVKTKKIVDHKPQPSRTTVKETPKPAEPVFEDPLSMFGDDD